MLVYIHIIHSLALLRFSRHLSINARGTCGSIVCISVAPMYVHVYMDTGKNLTVARSYECIKGKLGETVGRMTRW